MIFESRQRIQFSVPVRQGPQSWVHVEHIYFGSGLQYIDQSSLNTGEEKKAANLFIWILYNNSQNEN